MITGTEPQGVAQPESFTFSPDNMVKIKAIIAKYPEGKQASAVIPLLDLAQRQVGNFLPTAAMNTVAELLDMPPIKVYEVASFYTMFYRTPVGKNHVQVCTTTPCWLRGSEGITNACKSKLGIGFGETTADGQFSMEEVECLGSCVNAPMVQINDDTFEDLTPERMTEILEAIAKGQPVKGGSQTGRQNSCAATGPTSLKEGV